MLHENFRHGVDGLSTSTAQRAALFALRQEIDVLNRASEGLRAAEANAVSVLAEIEQMPARIHNANSLVSRLPDELLAEIFIIGSEYVEALESESKAKSMMKYVLDVSSVSHVWRRVAISTPSLWTSITYDYPLSSDDFPDLDGMECHLSRSKIEPLDVAITFEPRQIGQLKRLLDLLKPQLHRCRRLEMNLSNYTVGHVLPLPGPLTQLAFLDVCVSDFSRNQSEQPAVPLRLMEEQHQCTLESLDIAGPYPFKRSHLNPSHLSRLRYISSETQGAAVARFAAHFPFLETLDITMVKPEFQRQDRYILPSMHTLTVNNLEAFGVLQHIEGPSLRHLRLGMQPDVETEGDIPRDVFPTRHPLRYPHMRTFTLASSTIESDLTAAGMLANYIAVHPLMKGLHLYADVLGLDTLMMLAAIAVDRTQSEQYWSLRLIRLALIPVRYGGFSPPASSKYAEVAELLKVFLQCLPTIRLQVQLLPGMRKLPKPFRALMKAYPSNVECELEFETYIPDVVDEMEVEEAAVAERFAGTTNLLL